MPSGRTLKTYTVESLPPIVTTTTTTRKTRKFVVPDDEDGFSRETIVRRQDQKIKDDITNKLYRIEMDRVKPSVDVQLQTAHFRARPRIRTVTPEPVPCQSYRSGSVDMRRYSTAGNLDIYRPKIQRYGFERSAPDHVVEYVSSSNALVPYGWRSHQAVGKIPNNDLFSEYDFRKIAELKVRGGADHDTPNGTLVKSSQLRYLPPVREVSSPPILYRYTTEIPVTSQAVHQPDNRAKRVLSDGQYELDQFEKLMNRNFGTGGLNRTKTLLYSSPPYASAYEPYILPYSSSHYTSRPYYSGSYTYSYPYTSSTAPYRYNFSLPHSYYVQRPHEYESIYSPPSRVTAPGGYYPSYYNNSDYRGGYYSPYKPFTYTTYVR